MTKSKQRASGVRVKGKITQDSDAQDASQSVIDAEASKLEQKVESNQQSLGLGKYKATGKVAVVGLVIIVVLYVLANSLLNN